MAWRKLGCLYCPEGNRRHPKLLTHAANPLPVHLEGDRYRVFFSGRDSANRSSVGAVDIDLVQRRVLHEHTDPIFEHGPPGSFHADGVSIGNCYETIEGRFMLFMGWRSPADAHWRGEIGRLRLTEDLHLALDGDGPFMPLDAEDGVSMSYPWVMQQPSGSYAMWYGSTLRWDGGNGEMVHVIKHAASSDGERWHKDGLAVPYGIGTAQAFSRPTVLSDASGRQDMWFSYRSGLGESYRIGYASSPDGRSWSLKLDEAGIDVSAEGWDSQMIEYPFVLEHAGEHYMFYNGNGYGKSGFGLAVLSHG